jgi:GH15 family glucan-1,4-alpha-glucosidase
VNNAAACQLQLDCYGEVIDAASRRFLDGDGDLDRATGAMLGDFGRYVVEHWQEPDQGIWEERGAARPHTHSRVLCWVALDRLLALRRRGVLCGLSEDLLATTCDRIRHDVVTRGFDPMLSSYTEALGGTEIDASLLLLAWYGFEAPASLRMAHTLERIEARLGAGRGLYHRNEDSRRRGEGAFGICSFWVADYLARAGRVDEARDVFDAVLDHGNDLGLFGEEIDPATGGALGNFPQAYTHVGLVNAALSIAAAEQAR